MILVTGASGFVGSAVTRTLARTRAGEVLAAVRRTGDESHSDIPVRKMPDLLPDSNWASTLRDVDEVIHTAARAHVMLDTTNDPLAAFRAVNTVGTLNLARQAARKGVRRFIFISSVKVNGEATFGRAFHFDDAPGPLDPYGISKMEAEQGLREIATETGMAVTIIRPTLVYGPGVKANFRALMRWIHRGVPLPLGAIHNQRSMIALDNLVDLVVNCVGNPAAANQTFLASDGEDMSTTELVQRLARALRAPVRLVPVPAAVLKFAALLVGRRDLAQRLCGSLQVDISRTRDVLHWSPPFGVDQGLATTAESFLREFPT